MSGGPASLLIKRRALLISAVAFISYAYFYQGGGWNQNSRFDLVRAIVEQQTLRIDAYHDNTYDKAYYQGHYYSDKAPGLALLAVPAAALERPLLRAVGIDPASPRAWVGTSYFVTLFAVALPAAFACACLFLIAFKLGSSEGGAAFAHTQHFSGGMHLRLRASCSRSRQESCYAAVSVPGVTSSGGLHSA